MKSWVILLVDEFTEKSLEGDLGDVPSMSAVATDFASG